MFDKVINRVAAFLKIHGSSTQVQEFTKNMQKAWKSDFNTVGRIRVMEGRIFQMMQNCKKMKNMKINIVHWIQPKGLTSIHILHWKEKNLFAEYVVEDGITVQEFINRMLTTMITEPTHWPKFSDDLFLRNPRLYVERIMKTLPNQTCKPCPMDARIGKIQTTGNRLDSAFDFADEKDNSLRDLIYRAFDTNSHDFPEWLDNWTTVYWSECSRKGANTADCSYNPDGNLKEHDGHVIHRDKEGSINHLVVSEPEIRRKPLSSIHKFQPKITPDPEQPSTEDIPIAGKLSGTSVPPQPNHLPSALSDTTSTSPRSDSGQLPAEGEGPPDVQPSEHARATMVPVSFPVSQPLSSYPLSPSSPVPGSPSPSAPTSSASTLSTWGASNPTTATTSHDTVNQLQLKNTTVRVSRGGPLIRPPPAAPPKKRGLLGYAINILEGWTKRPKDT
ncbi:hypothetical protein BJ165DRAFT_158173 [Panaeolus papilionaceus]|nr:hypothetical protein BJ165DRAFT_158173 [Panaeolus papilionaceus]